MSRKGGNYHVSYNPRSADIYTDGACASNGRDGAKAGIGVHWPGNESRDVSEPIHGRQTNNSAEILAAERGIRQAKELGYEKVTVNTDSRFLIDSQEKWKDNWQRNDWRKADGEPVKNRSDFEALNDASRDIKVTYKHVLSHSGNAGNDAADRLAKQGAVSRRF